MSITMSSVPWNPFRELELSSTHWAIKQWAHQPALRGLHPSPHLACESSWKDHQPQLSIHKDVLKYHLGRTQGLGQTLPAQGCQSCRARCGASHTEGELSAETCAALWQGFTWHASIVGAFEEAGLTGRPWFLQLFCNLFFIYFLFF